MKCTVQNCPGDYERRLILHTVKFNGQIIVIQGVPADVCSVCGDTLLDVATMKRIEEILAAKPAPIGTAPLLSFAA